MEFSFQSNHLLSLNTTTTPSADELFLNGTILPLKLPPCLQIITNMDTNTSSRRTTTTRRRSPISPRLLSSSFRCENKDLDPFMLALEVVRKEVESPKRRRVRSLSPLRTSFWVGSKEEEQDDDDDERMGSCKVGKRKLVVKDWRFRREGDQHDGINGRFCKRSSGMIMEEFRKKSVKLCRHAIFTCFGFKP